MSIFEISEVERSALAGLPLLAREVYIFGLKPFAAPTGVVEGVTIQSIREELFVEPHPGVRDSGSPSADDVRAALAQLKSRGLIEHLGEHPQRVQVRLAMATVVE